jgi:hypothetical protein
VEFGTGFFWNSTNNRLGIGTSSPDYKQTIIDSSNLFTQRLSNTATTGRAGIFMQNNATAYAGFGTYGTAFTVGALQNNTTFFASHDVYFSAGDVSNAGIIYFTNGASRSNERMRIASTGNVLINTTTDAGFKLDVNGTARVSGQLTATSVNSSSIGLVSANQLIQPQGTSTGEFRFVNGGGGGWFFTWCQNSGAAIPPAERMRLSANNNLLIGTATDAGFRLDVNGTARVRSSGNSSATTGLTVQNSSSTTWLSVRDDGRIQIGTTNAQTFIQGATTFQAQTAADNMVVFQGALTTGTFFRTYLSGTDYPLEANANGLTIRSSGNTAQNASSVLDVQSTTKGFLPPRMTTTQKNAIASPAAGLVVYDTTLAKLCVYTTTWETITSL